MQFAAYGGVGLLIIIVQVLISRFLSIAGVSPDFLLIFLMYVTMREGQFAGIISAFVLGLLLDVMSSGILGAHALSLTVACFLAGMFYDRERVEQNIRNWPFLVLTLLGAIVNNGLYYFLMTRGGEMSFEEFAFRYGAVGALYTVFIAIFPLLYWSRKRAY